MTQVERGEKENNRIRVSSQLMKQALADADIETGESLGASVPTNDELKEAAQIYYEHGAWDVAGRFGGLIPEEIFDELLQPEDDLTRSITPIYVLRDLSHMEHLLAEINSLAETYPTIKDLYDMDIFKLERRISALSSIAGEYFNNLYEAAQLIPEYAAIVDRIMPNRDAFLAFLRRDYERYYQETNLPMPVYETESEDQWRAVLRVLEQLQIDITTSGNSKKILGEISQLPADSTSTARVVIFDNTVRSQFLHSDLKEGENYSATRRIKEILDKEKLSLAEPSLYWKYVYKEFGENGVFTVLGRELVLRREHTPAEIWGAIYMNLAGWCSGKNGNGVSIHALNELLNRFAGKKEERTAQQVLEKLGINSPKVSYDAPFAWFILDRLIREQIKEFNDANTISEAVAHTDKGRVMRNEDFPLARHFGEKSLLIVADGIGSMDSAQHGALAFSYLLAHLIEAGHNPHEAFKILRDSIYGIEHRDLPTTLERELGFHKWLTQGRHEVHGKAVLAAMLVDGDKAKVVNTGDVRVHRGNPDSPQSWSVSKDRVLAHPTKPEETLVVVEEANTLELDLAEGDTIMIATDGLYKALGEKQIQKLLQSGKGIDEIRNEIIKLTRGRHDDSATFILYRHKSKKV